MYKNLKSTITNDNIIWYYEDKDGQPIWFNQDSSSSTSTNHKTLLKINKNDNRLDMTCSKHNFDIAFININTIPKTKGNTTFNTSYYEEPDILIEFIRKAYSHIFYPLYFESSGNGELSLNYKSLGFTKAYTFIARYLKTYFPDMKCLICDYSNKNLITEDDDTVIVNRDFFNGVTVYQEQAKDLIFRVMIDDKLEKFYKNEEELKEYVKFPKESINKNVTNLIKNISNDGKIDKEAKEEIFKLSNIVEIKNLNEFLLKYKEALNNDKHKEKYWQNLFNENIFILQMLFPYPLISFNKEYSIKGQKIDKDNTRIADFVAQNQMTGNACIIELKRPCAKLLGTKQYRNGLYKIDKDFSNAINQLNDQIYALTKNDKDYKSYNPQGILIIGKALTLNNTEDEANKNKSFELYRNSFKNIRVVTFDEISAQLENLKKLLRQTNN